MTNQDRNLVSRQELHKFGLIFGGLVIILFGLLIPYLAGSLWQKPWPWYLGTAVILLALIWSASLKPLYLVWMKFGDIAGWINTRIILFLLFFFVIFPVGLLMKLFGSDPLHRKADGKVDTYRVTCNEVDKDHMEKPY